MNIESGAAIRADRPTLWHPFADMASVASDKDLVLVRGEGVWVEDDSGARYLDATAALWYCNIGHGRDRLARVAAEQMRRLAGYQIFDDLSNMPAIDLADRVCGLARSCGFAAGSAAFLTSGGSDGVETACKIARRHWRLLDRPEKTVVISRAGAYHGMHGYGTALAGIEANASGWGPLITDVVQVGRDDLDALEQALEAHSGRVAAFIGEPVQGAAGVFPPVDGYWAGVQDLCREHQCLLIADEVVTGFGRLGRVFGCERFGIEPDLLIGAKGLSSGYSPIGMVLATPELLDVLWSEDAGTMRHGYTYSGHPVSSAVALENLDVLEEEKLVERVAALEPHFAAAFARLAAHPHVAEVRSVGLLAAVELTDAALAAGVLPEVHREARAQGVLTRILVGCALQFSPAFVIEEAEIDLLCERIESALDAVPVASAA